LLPVPWYFSGLLESCAIAFNALRQRIRARFRVWENSPSPLFLKARQEKPFGFARQKALAPPDSANHFIPAV